ncbi:MAG: sugar phosphate isomerase/epimerase, partial [Candidatus Hydrogenedentes bacterium]|nr:sugar phosphate isomerase/epimerase [Candidatus Hydrogenedentota bacterium]
MLNNRITRRSALLAGTRGALPLMLSSSASAAGPYKPSIGMATLGFGKFTNEALAEELAANGITMVQLFLNQTDSKYWKYKGRSDLSDLTAARCAAIGDAYRTNGVEIHSMGVYTNLIHPDEGERAANLAYFEAMMKAGTAMGVRTFITEAGHYEPEKTEHVAYHFQDAVWTQMVATGKELAGLAERHDAKVLFEPFYRGFLATAKRMKLFLEAIDSPRVRALLDPANLLEVNDLEEMFDQLGPWIDCFHAKNRKLHTANGVAADQGDLDYVKFVSLASQH